MSRVLRLGATAFIADLALYLVWVAIPYKAISLGASAALLGIVSTVSSSTYVVTSLVSGRLSDRISRLRLARCGAILFVVGCLLVMRAGSLPAMLMRMPLMGLGMGCFWSPLQAAIADEGDRAALEGNIGLFNVFWSLGKTCGFLIGGSLYAWFGGAPLFYASSGLVLLVAAVIPSGARKPAYAPATVAEDSSPQPARGELRAFLYMAWIANAIGFGIGNTLNVHYPKFLLQLGWGSARFGLYLGIVFATQTAAFWLLRRFRGWRLRRAPSYALQAGMIAATLLLPFLRSLPLVLLTAIPIGLALGLAYHASITYSLSDRSSRGQRAGIHEALLGAGNFVLPLAGGALVAATGDLRMPYWFCSLALLVGVGVQEVVWRRRRGASAAAAA